MVVTWNTEATCKKEDMTEEELAEFIANGGEVEYL